MFVVPMRVGLSTSVGMIGVCGGEIECFGGGSGRGLLGAGGFWDFAHETLIWGLYLCNSGEFDFFSL